MLSHFTIDWGIAPAMYQHIFNILVSIFILTLFVRNAYSSGNRYLLTKQSQTPMTIFVIFMILFIGFRCVNSGDMASYRGWYLRRIAQTVEFNWSSEWMWNEIAIMCQNLRLSEWIWFAFITLGYIGCMFWSCKRLLFESVSLAMLFMFSSYSFFAYGTNTIRNGLACSLVLLAMSFFADKRKKWWIGGLLLFVAFGIHRSTIIPIVAIFISLFLVKKIKFAIVGWLFSIVLSFFAGNAIMPLFSRFNDDRVESYFTNTQDAALFSSLGFRWDFLFYSAVPVFVAWYVCQKKKVVDKTFDFLASTYMIANAVWVICIRASYSDRFAYLSWFLYPMIIAYAFIRIPLHKNQDSTVSWVLLAHVGFSLFMFYILGK